MEVLLACSMVKAVVVTAARSIVVFFCNEMIMIKVKLRHVFKIIYFNDEFMSIEMNINEDIFIFIL